MNLEVLAGSYSICRLDPDTATPSGLARGALLSLTRTSDELSIVCLDSGSLPGKVDRGWRCLKVAGPLAFDQVGVLAALAQPLAEAGVSIFTISTFDTDYLLVKEDQLETGISALESAGHRVADG